MRWMDLRALRSSQREFLQRTLIPEAVSVWSESLSVLAPTNARHLLLDRECTDARMGSNGCPIACVTLPDTQLCGESTIIPTAHLAGIEYCPSPGNCTMLPNGAGVPNADFVLYVSARRENACDNDASARAGSCRTESARDRPVAGYINFCPTAVAERTRSWTAEASGTSWGAQRSLAVHEIGHALGFSSDLIGSWRHREDGRPRTPRDACGKVARTMIAGIWVRLPSASTLKLSGGSTGVLTATVVTPTVRRVTRDFFNCSELDGAELENQPSTGALWGSHWEQRIFSTETMAAVQSIGRYGEHLSALTLAFFHDSGWYTAAFNSSAVTVPRWGLKQGCRFAQEACIRYGAAIAEPFCTVRGAVGCTADHSAIARCNLRTHSSPIQTSRFRYFADPRYGGSPKTDYCPFYEAISDCRAPTSSQPVGYVDVRGAPNSVCLMTEPPLLAPGFASSALRMPACLLFDCDPTTQHFNVTISGGYVQTCRYRGQQISFPGHTGRVVCPAYAKMCDPKYSDLLPLLAAPPPPADDTSNSISIAIVVGIAALIVGIVGSVGYWICSTCCHTVEEHPLDAEHPSSDTENASSDTEH